MKKLLSTLLFLFVVAIFSLSAQVKGIYPPSLNSPEDEAINQMPDVILDWAAVVGSGVDIVEYQLTIDTDPSFASAITYDPVEFTGMQMENLLFNQDYYWKVRAMEGNETSGWSATYKFTTFEMLTLLRPNDASDEEPPDVTLKLKTTIGSSPSVPLSGIDMYEFQADTSMNFDSPLYWEGSTPELNMNTSFLHFGEVYYWKARATTQSDISTWSEMRTFEVIDFVELDKPNNNSSDMGLKLSLKWDELTGITDYELQVSDTEDFTGALLSQTVEGTIDTVDNFMTFGTDYWWRVRANHPTDTSGWSDPNKFTTISTPTPILPADMATDVKVTPLFTWEEVSGIDTFNLVYGNTPGIENPIADLKVKGSQFNLQSIIILDKNTSYYWKIRGIKGVEISDWSDTFTFTTLPEVGISEPFDKNNISIYPNPSSGTLHINIDGDDKSEVTIYIMDLLGQVHVEQNALFSQGNSSKSFDLSSLANGLYLVKLNKGDQSYTHKIAIHK